MPRTGRPREYDADEALDAALPVFWRRGYEATSLADLRSATGLSSASLYTAFGSKEGLYRAAIDRYVQTYGQATAPAGRPELAPREAVELTLRRSVEMQTDAAHPPGCLVTLAGSPPGEANESLREMLERLRAVDRRNLTDCVRRGVDGGELPRDTDVEAVGLTFHTLLAGISAEARDHVGRDALDRAVDAMMRLWDGLAAAAAS